MVDINRWFECITEQPSKKGKYLLMVGLKDRTSGCYELGVVESFWNGKNWDVHPLYSRCKWKYRKPGEIEKYPDFNNNINGRNLQ